MTQNADKADNSCAKCAPKISTVPAGMPFARTLAQTLLDRTAGNPESLCKILVLLPTRRACRILHESFLELSPRDALLLPVMQPIGDLEEEDLALGFLGANAHNILHGIKPAISPLKRQILLSRYVQAAFPDQPPGQSFSLARNLGHLLDQVYTENLNLRNIHSLVDENFSEHWKITVEFLKILSETWPAVLEAEGCIDAAQRRNLLITALCDYWEAHPPTTPVIAAGSTGSIPAVARLLGIIAKSPKGEIILPGMDPEIDDASWENLEETHPQYGFKMLLQHISLQKDCVTSLIDPTNRQYKSRAPARALAREIMRPSATTKQWEALSSSPIKDTLSSALENIRIIECEHEREEAEVIALLLRETLETPEKTACVITPDRTLAERIKAICLRWDIHLDDSAGSTLDKSSLGLFITLCANAAQQDFSPAHLMALLKHPLFSAGLDSQQTNAITQEIDIVLRGPKPKAGLNSLIEHIENSKEQTGKNKNALIDFLKHLEQIYKPFLSLLNAEGSANMAELLKAHLDLCETLADTPHKTGKQILWSGQTGSTASAFFSSLLQIGEAFPPLPLMQRAENYAAILQHFISQAALRTPYGVHPRLHIYGQLEARLINADRVILAGLNEGTWPADPGADPWMSRPMRKKFGLPSLERSIGLAAHDFVQGLCMPETILTRSRRKDNGPCVPARWLLRLNAVLKAAKLELSDRNKGVDILAWSRALDHAGPPRAISKPAPCPPAALRPRNISLTDIETWLKDPYSIYAKYILKLKKLDELEEKIDKAQLGSLLHKILERSIRDDDCSFGHFMSLVREEITLRQWNEENWTFWLSRLERFAHWFERQSKNNHETTSIGLELKGRLSLSGPLGPFTITGRADRIDRHIAGGAVIIDYKSGGSYSGKAVNNGDLPQLPAEALMLASGGFENLGAMKTRALQYWICNGSGEGGTVINIEDGLDDTIQQTLTGIQELIERYDNPQTPYPSLPVPGIAPKYSDYEHLARIKEWAMESDDGESFSGEVA